MSRKLSATDIFDTVEVDLWGNAYTLRTITRSVGARLDDVKKKGEALEEGSAGDEAAEVMIEMIDILLEPGEDVQPAGELLGGLWKNDELGADWLTAFATSLQEEAAERRRPTSPRAKSS